MRGCISVFTRLGRVLSLGRPGLIDLPASHSLSARIAAIDDLQHLKQLHRAAIQVTSLEAFGHLLDE